MNYRGFTIVHAYGQWRVRVSAYEEWLATSKEDACQQVDEYINRNKHDKENKK